MPKPRALTPQEAKRTLAHRFGPRGDRLRQLATRFGVRPYRCFLVWTKYTGGERGEGSEKLVAEAELLPTPKVISLDSVTYSPYHAGTFPDGSVKLDRVSVGYTADFLRGLVVPKREEHLPEPYDFFYELREDGRGDDPAARDRYRLLSPPFRQPGRVCWVLMLERSSEDRTRTGLSRHGVDPDIDR